MDIESEAKLQGWVPHEEFKGDSSKWVDAESYVERGKHIMPILQSNNKRLLSELDSVKSVVESLKATVDNQNQSMEELKAFHQESTKAQVEKARREILADLKEAKTDGDVDQEIKITAELSQFDAAQVEAKKAQVVTPTPTPSVSIADQELDKIRRAWVKENPWYGIDLERTGLMDGVARRLRNENVELYGRDFLDAAAKIVADRWGDVSEPATSKVEGGSGRGASSRSGATGSYASLPSDAKEACEKQSSRFVGPDKVYKNKKEWQEFFASEYHKGN